jgi:hypothetical protein
MFSRPPCFGADLVCPAEHAQKRLVKNQSSAVHGSQFVPREKKARIRLWRERLGLFAGNMEVWAGPDPVDRRAEQA